MRIIGVCVASLALTLALPLPPIGKLVPREGDLEAAIYDEAIADIAGDPYISNALEDLNDTANAGIAADEGADAIPDALDNGILPENDPDIDIPVDPAVEIPLDDANAATYQQDPQVPYVDGFQPLDTTAYENQITTNALTPALQAVSLDDGEYLEIPPETNVPEILPIPAQSPVPVAPYSDLTSAAPAPPIKAEYLPERPIQPAAPTYSSPLLSSKVPENVPPALPLPAVPAPDHEDASAAYTLMPNTLTYEATGKSPVPVSLDAQVDTLPPPAVPEQIADIQPQTGVVKDTVAENAESFNPIEDLLQGLSDGLGSLLNGLNGIAGSTEKLPADDPYPVAQPVFAV